MIFNQPIRRSRRGDFDVRLPAEERRLLARLVPQLRQLLDEPAPADDPTLRRLFPTAYPDDAERDAEYRGLVHDDLVERRRAALDTVASTIDATRMTEDELVAWMGAVNDLRLVLGTRLDVSEETDLRVDPDDPDAAVVAVYGYLGYLLEHIVLALSS